MRTIFFVALLVLSLGLAGSAPAVAQSADSGLDPDDVTGDSPQPTDGERIDSETVIVSSEYIANRSVALITIRSESAQAITLSDAGRFQEGGKIPVRSVALGAGETATIELPVTETNGVVGVAISTEKTSLYAEIIKQSSSDGGLEILQALGSLQAWFAGISVAFIWMVVAGWSVLRGEDSRPEVA